MSACSQSPVRFAAASEGEEEFVRLLINLVRSSFEFDLSSNASIWRSNEASIRRYLLNMASDNTAGGARVFVIRRSSILAGSIFVKLGDRPLIKHVADISGLLVLPEVRN